MMMRSVFALATITLTAAHSRFTCPPARNLDGQASTGIKNGPCGGDAYSKGAVSTLSPGPLTVVIQESITHVGAPWRIDLLGPDDEVVCNILDHVPHNDASTPDYKNEATWVDYMLTIQVPDVDCPKCSIQMVNPMTDKLAGRGMTNCTDPSGTCFSVYHSCANVQITGTKALSASVCELEPDWPWKNLTANVYKPNEAATWTDGYLTAAPASFQEKDKLCVVGSLSVVTPSPTTGTGPDSGSTGPDSGSTGPDSGSTGPDSNSDTDAPIDDAESAAFPLSAQPVCNLLFTLAGLALVLY